ncbi:MAG: AAA family ATPase [Lachnospiraceae bacterium]
MKKYAVTITRQFGSLGRPIAKRMSELLGVEYYDREIVDMTAKKLNLPVSEVSDQEESVKTAFFKMRYPFGSGTTQVQDSIFLAQQRIISEFVKHKSCIVVGRCSDYILKNMENCIHIFIYAPYEQRLKNCVEDLHLTESEAKKMIEEVDKARDSYHKHYAGYLPQDIHSKQLLIDSSILGVEGTAEYLVDLVKRKFSDETE